MRVLPAPGHETLLLLSTDGYSKSYETDAAFKQIGPDYLELIREGGVSSLNLRGFLEQVTNKGSGDDIALALLYYPPIEDVEIQSNPTAKEEGSLPGETEASEYQECESAEVSLPDAAENTHRGQASEDEPRRMGDSDAGSYNGSDSHSGPPIGNKNETLNDGEIANAEARTTEDR